VWEGFLAYGIKITFTSSHLIGIGLEQGSRERWLSARVDIYSVSVVAGKNPSGPGDLKGFKELIAHLMRSGFQILSIL